MRWMRIALSKALENKAAEAQVIDAAWRVYSARFEQARQHASTQDKAAKDAFESGAPAPLQLNQQKPAEVFAFLQRLRQQHRMAAEQAQALEQLLYDRLDERMDDLTARRTHRQMQKIIRHREERIRVEKERVEEEEREAARKKQALEAKRLRALQKEEQERQQAAVDNAASSTVTA